MIRNLRLLTKFITSDWTTNNYNTHIPSILRITAIQGRKFGHLIKHSMRNLFLKNHTENVMKNLVTDHFLKNQNQHISGLTLLNFTQLLFIVFPSR